MVLSGLFRHFNVLSHATVFATSPQLQIFKIGNSDFVNVENNLQFLA